MKICELVIASSNNGKIEEIKHILSDFPLLVRVIDLSDITEPDEPYQTFVENAAHKCRYYANYTKTITLSEDTGLCIEGLDGWPGINTKNFIQDCGGVANAMAELEKIMRDIPNKRAYFHCAAAIYTPKLDLLITHEAKLFGKLVLPPIIKGGFALDPILIPDGHTKTLAELGQLHKCKISHRSQAVRDAVNELLSYDTGDEEAVVDDEVVLGPEPLLNR